MPVDAPTITPARESSRSVSSEAKSIHHVPGDGSPHWPMAARS